MDKHKKIALVLTFLIPMSMAFSNTIRSAIGDYISQFNTNETAQKQKRPARYYIDDMGVHESMNIEAPAHTTKAQSETNTIADTYTQAKSPAHSKVQQKEKAASNKTGNKKTKALYKDQVSSRGYTSAANRQPQTQTAIEQASAKQIIVTGVPVQIPGTVSSTQTQQTTTATSSDASGSGSIASEQEQQTASEEGESSATEKKKPSPDKFYFPEEGDVDRAIIAVDPDEISEIPGSEEMDTPGGSTELVAPLVIQSEFTPDYIDVITSIQCDPIIQESADEFTSISYVKPLNNPDNPALNRFNFSIPFRALQQYWQSGTPLTLGIAVFTEDSLLTVARLIIVTWENLPEEIHPDSVFTFSAFAPVHRRSESRDRLMLWAGEDNICQNPAALNKLAIFMHIEDGKVFEVPYLEEEELQLGTARVAYDD